MAAVTDLHSQEVPMSSTSKPFASTAAYLEWLSTAVMEAHSSGDDRILHEHLAPDFEMVNASKHECPIPQAINLQQHLQNCVEFKRENPTWKVMARNVTVNMVKGSNSAEVWMTIRGCQSEEEIEFNRESVSVLHWRRRVEDGLWLCYRHQGVRHGGEMHSWDNIS